MDKDKLYKALEDRYGGVYALMQGNECVYIGESGCIPDRLKQHISQGVKEFDNYRIYYTPNRKEIESELIRFLRPKYNISENPDFYDRFDNKELSSKMDDLVGKIVNLCKKVGAPIPISLHNWAHKLSSYFLPIYYKNILEYVVKKYNCFLYREYDEDLYDLRVLNTFQKEIVDEVNDIFLENTKKDINLPDNLRRLLFSNSSRAHSEETSNEK